MELSDLKRSLEDQLKKEANEVDPSVFTTNKKDSNKSPPDLTQVSVHAHIPEGALVRREIEARKKDREEFLGISTSNNVHNNNVFPPPGEVEKRRMQLSDDEFLKKLFGADDIKKTVQEDTGIKRQQEDTPMLPKKTDEEKKQVTIADHKVSKEEKKETPMLPSKTEKDKRQDTPMLPKKTEKRDSSEDDKDSFKDQTKEIPNFLRDAIAEEEIKTQANNKVDEKLMKEFSVNKAYQHFDHQEKKTGMDGLTLLILLKSIPTRLFYLFKISLRWVYCNAHFPFYPSYKSSFPADACVTFLRLQVCHQANIYHQWLQETLQQENQ